MQAPVLDASSPGVTPDRPPPQDISVFTVPKKPPVLESSGERPLRDIDLATPASPHTAARPGRRQRHPQSPWVARWARSASVTVAGAALSMPSAGVFDSLEDSRGRGEFSGHEAHRFPRQGRVGISQAV